MRAFLRMKEIKIEDEIEECRETRNLIEKNAEILSILPFRSWESYCVKSDTSNHAPWIRLKERVEKRFVREIRQYFVNKKFSFREK